MRLLLATTGLQLTSCASKPKRGTRRCNSGVGYLYLEWLGDPDAKGPSTHQADEALEWIRKAVSQGSPQAAGVLRSGYEWGRYTLPKNAELETCWRRVENGDQDASVCLAAEEALD